MKFSSILKLELSHPIISETVRFTALLQKQTKIIPYFWWKNFLEHYKRGGEDNFLFFTVLNPMTKYQDYDYNSILYEERFDRKKKLFFSKKSHIHPYILHTNRLPLIEKTWSRKNNYNKILRSIHSYIMYYQLHQNQFFWLPIISSILEK